MSRRDVLKGSAATIAAGLVSTEAAAAPKPLDKAQRELVDRIVAEALQKTDRAGRVLMSEAMGGALEKNFRGYVTLQRAGPAYTKFRNQREVMNDRDKKIIRDPAFIKDLLQNLKKAGLIEDSDITEAVESTHVRVVHRDNAEYNEGQSITFKYGIRIGEKVLGDEDVLNPGN